MAMQRCGKCGSPITPTPEEKLLAAIFGESMLCDVCYIEKENNEPLPEMITVNGKPLSTWLQGKV